MTPSEIASQMTLTGYVDHAIVSGTPEETVETLVSNGLQIIGRDRINGYDIVYLDPEGI